MKVLLSDLAKGKYEIQKEFINLIREYDKSSENTDKVKVQTIYDTGFKMFCRYMSAHEDFEAYKEKVKREVDHEIVKGAEAREAYAKLKAKFDKLQEAITLFKDGKVSKDELVGILLLEEGE